MTLGLTDAKIRPSHFTQQLSAFSPSQIRLGAFIAHLALKLVALFALAHLLAPASGLALAGSVAAAGALAAWVVIMNEVRSRERFLSQCVRPAALMVPETHQRASGSSPPPSVTRGGSGRVPRGSSSARTRLSSEADWADAPATPEAARGPARPIPGSTTPAAPDTPTARARAAAPAVTPPVPTGGRRRTDAGGATADGSLHSQVFMPIGFRERSCLLLVKDAGRSTSGAGSLRGLAARGGTRCDTCLLPGCELMRMGLLVRSDLHAGPGGGGPGFWGSASVAAVCAALRHTPPSGGAAASGGRAAGVPSAGGTGAIPAMPPSYQEMQCIVLVGLDSSHDEGGAVGLPPW